VQVENRDRSLLSPALQTSSSRPSRRRSKVSPRWLTACTNQPASSCTRRTSCGPGQTTVIADHCHAYSASTRGEFAHRRFSNRTLDATLSFNRLRLATCHTGPTTGGPTTSCFYHIILPQGTCRASFGLGYNLIHTRFPQPR